MRKIISNAMILHLLIILLISCKKESKPALNLEDQSFSVTEFSYNGKRVGKINTGVYDGRDINFAVIQGNINNAFFVNDSTGEISVNNSHSLEYETIKVFNLKVHVQDEYGYEDTTIVTIEIIDIASTENFIAYFSFNGNVNDYSGNNNHGIVHCAVPTSDQFGNENSAYYFDGVDSYISIDPVSDVSEISDFTISVKTYCEGWRDQSVFNTVYIDRQDIFNCLNFEGISLSYCFYKEGLNNDKEVFEFEIIASDEGISSTRRIENPIQTWHHFVLLRKNGEVSLYIDGNIFYSSMFNDEPMNLQNTWYIGANTGNKLYEGFNVDFYGRIDEVMILNIALDEEILKEL
jgi:hypothetical protein